MLRSSLALSSLFVVCLAASEGFAAQADLRLGPLIAPNLSTPAGYTTISVDYLNYGPAPATGVTMTLSIPQGATYRGFDSQPLMKCAEPPVGSRDDLVCTAASISPLPGGYVDLYVQIDGDTPPGTILTFPVTLTSSNAIKPQQAGSVSTTVVAPSDLAVSLSSPASVTAGESFISTITLTNKGPSDALTASVAVGSTAAIKQLSGPPGWTCSVGINGALCTDRTFAPGTATFTFTSFVPLSLPFGLTERVTVIAANESNGSENTATATCAIVPPPGPHHVDLQSAIMAPATIHAGQGDEWIMRLFNNGPDTVTSWHFSFQFPRSTSLRDARLLIDGGVCTEEPGIPTETIECSGYGLAPQETVTLGAFLSVASGASETLHATMTASTVDEDVNRQNDTASADTQIVTTPGAPRRRAVRH
jgi:uncharacterized protein DUF11